MPYLKKQSSMEQKVVYKPRGRPMGRIRQGAGYVKKGTDAFRRAFPNSKYDKTAKILGEAAEFVSDPLASPAMGKLIEYVDVVVSPETGTTGITPWQVRNPAINAPISTGAITNSFHLYKYGNKRKTRGLMSDFRASFDSDWQVISAVNSVGASEIPIFSGAAIPWPPGYTAPESASYKTMMDNIPTLTTLVTANQTKRAKFGNITVKTQFTNNGDTRATLRLYECIPKRDIVTSSSPSLYVPYAGVLGLDQKASPIYCWDAGLEATPTTPLLPNEYRIDMIGGKPTDSPMFNAYWEVKNTIVIDLDPNQNHNHSAVYSINRTVPNILFGATYPLACLQGMSPVLMATVTGKYGTLGDYRAANIFCSSKITVSYKSPALTQSFRTDYQTNS